MNAQQAAHLRLMSMLPVRKHERRSPYVDRGFNRKSVRGTAVEAENLRRRVVRLKGVGMTIREIADEVGISECSVNSYLKK